MSLPDRDTERTCATCIRREVTRFGPWCAKTGCLLSSNYACNQWMPREAKPEQEAPMLPDRDPTVAVELTPDAERITSRVEGWMRECRDRAERGQVKYPPWHTATTTRNAGGELREELLDALWYASAAEDQIAHLTAEVARLTRDNEVLTLERAFIPTIATEFAELAELARGAVESVNEDEWPDAKEWLRQGADLFAEAASGLADMPELPHGLAKRCADAEQECDDLRARIADLERERDRMLPVFEAANEWWHAAEYWDVSRAERKIEAALTAALAATQEARHD